MPTNLRRADFVLVTHLQATWRRAGVENEDPWLSVEREKRIWPMICHFDPTDGRYQGWLSTWRRRLWDLRGFRTGIDLGELEDVSRALKRFHSIKAKLPPEQRDIGQYHSAEDLLAIVPTRLAETRRRQERDSLKEEAYRQSRFLFREGRWIIVRLTGFTAARFWGLNTKWCTTSIERNFLHYAKDGDLLVFLTPHGKFQLATASQMFRDARDNPFDPAVFRHAPPGFFKLVQAYTRQ